MVCTPPPPQKTKKKNYSGQMGHFGPKNGTSCNSGLALRIFKKFCRMKGANRYMKIILDIFWEKIHLMQFDVFSL